MGRYAAANHELIHHAIGIFQDRHDDWTFIRHEDLAQNPVAGFERLFERVGLEFTPRICRCIEKETSARNPVEAKRVLDTRRDSVAVAYRWKETLTADEIARIRERVGETADRFTTEEEWK